MPVHYYVFQDKVTTAYCIPNCIPKRGEKYWVKSLQLPKIPSDILCCFFFFLLLDYRSLVTKSSDPLCNDFGLKLRVFMSTDSTCRYDGK